MSVSFSCHCEERKKPVENRNWVVLRRECNYSAFNGYQYESSRYSEIHCRTCGAMGRTAAKYVSKLKDGEL